MFYWVKLIQEISTILVGFIFYNEVWYFIYIFIHNSGYINKQKVSTEWNVCLLSKRQFNTEILNNPTIINITNKYICTSHPHSLNIKKTKTYADEYPWRWLGQVQTCGGENIFKPLFPLQPFNMCCPMCTKILNQVDTIYILKLQVKYYYVTCIYWRIEESGWFRS